MISEKLTQLTEEELMQEEKKQKSSLKTFKIIICLMIGVAIYNATHKGMFLISCLPLFFMHILLTQDKNYKALLSEIQSRQSQ